MPTSLPANYVFATRSPFLSWLSTSLVYLTLPPLLTLFVTLIIVGYRHPSMRETDKAFHFKWTIATCDEMTACPFVETPSIRKMKRQ